jgi:hypothetical protein
MIFSSQECCNTAFAVKTTQNKYFRRDYYYFRNDIFADTHTMLVTFRIAYVLIKCIYYLTAFITRMEAERTSVVSSTKQVLTCTNLPSGQKLR